MSYRASREIEKTPTKTIQSVATARTVTSCKTSRRVALRCICFRPSIFYGFVAQRVVDLLRGAGAAGAAGQLPPALAARGSAGAEKCPFAM